MAVINIKSMIEHTLLRPDATIEDIIHLCGEAEAASLCGVCVHPVYGELAANRLRPGVLRGGHPEPGRPD